jgi:hypothetical protein
MDVNQGATNDARPKPPIWRRAGRWLFLLLALLVVLHLGWGALKKRKLTRVVDQYRREGELMLPEDFDEPAIPGERMSELDLAACVANGTIDLTTIFVGAGGSDWGDAARRRATCFALKPVIRDDARLLKSIS